MPDIRYYFINHDALIVKHYAEKPEKDPEGYEYCGMSQLPIRGAAGYYSKNQSGFSIVDGDQSEETSTNDDVSKT